jgi:hypothetical protein
MIKRIKPKNKKVILNTVTSGQKKSSLKPPVKNKPYMPKFTVKPPVKNKPYMPTFTNPKPGETMPTISQGPTKLAAPKTTISKGGIGNKEVNPVYRNQGFM